MSDTYERTLPRPLASRGSESSSGSSHEPSGARIKAVGQRDPSRWSTNVVRALCARLPESSCIGCDAVTVPCEECHSAFYPCLCSKKLERGPSLQQTRAPRIVEEAESRRVNGTGVGNLRVVLNDRHCGMYSRRLLASRHSDTLSAATKGLEGDPSAIAGDVISRRGSRYVLKPEGEKDWEQELILDHKELSILRDILDEKLEVAGGSRLKGQQLEAMVFNEARDRAVVKRNTLLSATPATMTQPLPPTYTENAQHQVLRSVQVKYAAEKMAKDDMTLVRLHDDFYVRSVASEGFAHSAGVRVGHMLLELRRATPKSNRKMVKMHPMAALPEVLVVRDAMKDDRQALSWPCQLTFDVLPAGWRAAKLMAWEGAPTEEPPTELPGHDALPADFTDWHLDRLFHANCSSAHILFKRTPHAVVCRDSEHVVRHEHRWERYVKFDQDADIKMLRHWNLEAHMSPMKMNYVFRRLIKVLQKELSGFALHRYEFITSLLRKVRMMVALETAAHHDPCRARCAKLKAQAAGVEREISGICSECPIFVLEVIKDECKPMVGPVPEDILGYSLAGKRMPSRRHSGGSMRSTQSGTGSMSPAKLRFGGLKRQLTQAFEGTEEPAGVGPDAEDEDEEHPVVDGSLLSSVQDVNATLAHAEAHQRGQVRCEAHPTDIINRLDHLITNFLSNSAKGSSSGSEAEEWRAASKPKHYRFKRAARRVARQARNRVEAKDSLYYEGDRASKNMDGRLSFDEFQAAFVACGITHFTTGETRDLFEALDVNNDGYLIIPEVLRIAYRMADLSDLLVQHEQRETASGRVFHSKKELFDDFSHYHLHGEDLVGTTLNNKIPDTRILVSSDFHSAPGTVRSTHRVRLDSNVAWMAHDTDLDEPFVEWRLQTKSKINAVVTLGHHSHRENRFVKAYRLKYSQAHPDSELASWEDYPHELSGNEDSVTSTVQRLDAFHATRVRIYPTDWYPRQINGLQKGPAMRASLRGFPITRESYVHHHTNV